MGNRLLLIMCMIMITSTTSAISSSSSSIANLSALNITVVEKALELEKERLASYGQWPPFLFFETADLSLITARTSRGPSRPSVPRKGISVLMLLYIKSIIQNPSCFLHLEKI
jgi:hypothetical protein